MHIASQQGVHACSNIGNPEELDFIEIGAGALLPVILVAYGDRTHTRRKFLALEWPGANAFRKIGRARLCDQEVIGAKDDRQIGIGCAKRDLDLVFSIGDDFLHLVGKGLCHGADCGIVVTLEREDHILGSQLLAIMELHAFAQLDGPDGRLLVLDGFGQRKLRSHYIIQLSEAVIEHRAAAIIGRVGLLGRIKRIGR